MGLLYGVNMCCHVFSKIVGLMLLEKVHFRRYGPVNLRFLNLRFFSTIIPVMTSLLMTNLQAIDLDNLAATLETSHFLSIVSHEAQKLQLKADSLCLGEFVRDEQTAKQVLEAIKPKAKFIESFHFQYYKNCDFSVSFLQDLMPACSAITHIYVLRNRSGYHPTKELISIFLHHLSSFGFLDSVVLEPQECDETLSFQMIAAMSQFSEKNLNMQINTGLFVGKSFFVLKSFLNTTRRPDGFNNFVVDSGSSQSVRIEECIMQIKPSPLTLETSHYNEDTLAGLFRYLEHGKGPYISGLTVRFPLSQDKLDNIKRYCPDIDVTVSVL